MTCANVMQRQAVLLGTKNIVLMIAVSESKSQGWPGCSRILIERKAVTSFPCPQMS